MAVQMSVVTCQSTHQFRKNLTAALASLLGRDEREITFVLTYENRQPADPAGTKRLAVSQVHVPEVSKLAQEHLETAVENAIRASISQQMPAQV